MELIYEQHGSRKGDFVFHHDGEQLDYWHALLHFQAACKKLEISFTDPDGDARLPGFHDLRRTFARMADRAGVAHRTIKEIAGWKNDAMLLRYLGKSRKDDQLDAFAKMAAFVKG